MRNKLTPKTTRILASDYSVSEGRAAYLQQVIIDGVDAEAVLKYADRFLELVEIETLEKLKQPNADHKEVATYYRVVTKFVEMLVSAAELGRQKEKAFEELKKATRRN